MNLNDNRYGKYALCREMLDTVEVIKNFDLEATKIFLPYLKDKMKLFLTGEGSSRLFPAKHIVYRNLINNCGREIFTEGSRQAMEYDLKDFVVVGISNSGKTKELVSLFGKLKHEQHPAILGVTANAGTPVQMMPHASVVLNCGTEKAVAATKSVVEQALIYHSLYFLLQGKVMSGLINLADMVKVALQTDIDPEIIKVLADADTLYFAGKNNGVAEEITLKTNEIARKKSGYLEGTYVVHGIEEVLGKKDVIIVFEPFPEEEEKFHQVLVENLGMKVFAIASRQTIFPTIRILDGGVYRNYVELAKGWSILTEIGLRLNINLDKPVHARKIGNEYVPTL